MVFRQRKPYDPEKAHSHAPVHLPEVEGQLFQSLSFLTSSSLNARARSSERLRDSAHFAVATRSYALAATPQLAAPPRGRWDLGPGEPRRAELRRGARRGRGAEGRGEEARGGAAERRGGARRREAGPRRGGRGGEGRCEAGPRRGWEGASSSSSPRLSLPLPAPLSCVLLPLPAPGTLCSACRV